MKISAPLVAAVLGGGATFSLVQPASAADYKSVVGILEEKCFKCHSETEKVKGNLALDIDEVEMFIGSNHPIIPGKADESSLYLMAAHSDDYDPMPPRGKGEALSPSELKKLKAWIDEGALLPGQKAEPKEEAKPNLPTEVLGWTNANGQEMRAALVQVRDEDAIFRLSDGRTTTYPLSKLSDASRAKVLELAGGEGEEESAE